MAERNTQATAQTDAQAQAEERARVAAEAEKSQLDEAPESGAVYLNAQGVKVNPNGEPVDAKGNVKKQDD